MTAAPFISLADLGRMFSDADLRPPTRETLIRRGRKIADAYGMTVLTVDRRSFVARADVDRLAQGSAA